MMHIAWAIAFLLFDREAGRVRPSVITGLIVVVLAIIGHFWISGPWLREAGIP